MLATSGSTFFSVANSAGGKTPVFFAPHQRQHDRDIAIDRYEEADFLGKSGLDVIGAIIFAGKEPVRRQLAHPEDALPPFPSGMIEGIEQVRTGLIERHENDVLFAIEGAVEIDRPLFSAIGEDDDIVEAHECGHHLAERIAEARIRHG